MAASEAITGFGTKFRVETVAGSGVYFEYGEVTNITPPNEQMGETEVTHMQSPGGYIERIPTLVDPGDMSVEINYLPGSDTEDHMLGWKTTRDVRSCQIVWPASTGRVDTFPGYYKGFSPTMGAAEKLAGTITVGVAGEVVPT